MNSEPLFADLVGVMAIITMIPVFFLWLEKRTRWKVFDILPAIIWVFITPILLSNLGVIPTSSPIYDTFKSFAVPLVIVLMLLDINIRESLKVAWRGVGVLVFGSLGIVAGAAVAFYLFKFGLAPDSWSGFGALAGSWIGGTGNLAAVAESLQTPPEQVGIVVLVDNFVYIFYFPIILTCRKWDKHFSRFTGVSTRQLDEALVARKGVETKRQDVHFQNILTLIGFGFSAVLVANWAAGWMPLLPPVLTEKTWAMLLVTTLGVLLSATSLKSVPGTQPLSMALIYIYMTMIGASADLTNLAGSQWFLVAGFMCIAVHFLLVIAAARIFRVDVSTAAVASVAAVGGAASAPVAAAYHKEELVPISIMLALIGYALGNYLGVATAYLCYAML
jgi:uncharacterized membrane protein